METRQESGIVNHLPLPQQAFTAIIGPPYLRLYMGQGVGSLKNCLPRKESGVIGVAYGGSNA